MSDSKWFIYFKIFPCGGCNWPLIATNVEKSRHTKSSYANDLNEFRCFRCDWHGKLHGSQAHGFLEAEWNFEIRSLPRTDK